jgi:hypothetical protein
VAYRTWLNLLLTAALLLAMVVLVARQNDPRGITIEARDPPLEPTIEAAR